ncbi:pilus assembly protein [Dyella telluris]|uniref:Pilus assembly protein PilY n=1 Tax=Dyella telluris TaxID=2763498 RepID=A0A7G8Q629_9GAMM|nr:PilC/PilY family type IV pilus protein [Dyella telluris]QNK02237.1 pilus assembly protein PilY [Dyella telluris]
MSNPYSLRRRAGRFLGRLLGTGAVVCVLGIASTPSWAVTVEQQPLIIQKSLPPNLVLMLDDSGSMAWDVMPDWKYLAGRNEDDLTYSVVNGVYYNPTVTYKAPIKADGTRYADAAFDAAWYDGFNTGTGKVDLSSYDGSKDASQNGASKSDIAYTQTFTTVTGTSAPTWTCQSGDSLETTGTNKGKCKTSGRNPQYYSPNNPVCNSGDTYDSSSKQCSTIKILASLFKYTLKNSNGTYTRYYVGKTGACAAASLGDAVCTESSDVQKNVANWFSYYHTRLLMAKTGVMESFSGIDPSFRIGFGSIDGNNNSGLPSDRTTKNGYVIANVKPFSDQKAAFWSWLAGGKANNGTPLRAALDAVGQYYQTAQPWGSMSSDPDYNTGSGKGELACRQSYTILTTDGFWNGAAASTSIGDVDSTALTVKGTGDRSYVFDAQAPYRDGRSLTLADVAMYYWIKDLRTDTADEVPISDEDPAFWQHMTTFTLGLGFTPTNIQPSGTTYEQIARWARGGDAIKNFSWPAPAADDINNIADLAHAAINGHGSFNSASSPQEFSSALKDALKRAAERVGTGAALASNSTELTSGTVSYQANYLTAKWTGDLKAYPIVNDRVGDTATWTASAVLPAAANRKLYTSSNGADTFEFTTTNLNLFSADQQKALTSTLADNQAIIAYMRGDGTKEQRNKGALRNRSTALGDIVNSQPVYVGAPDANQFIGQNFTGSSAYVDFAVTKKERDKRVLVAANDGFIHAFNADSGVETHAYLPGAVITSGLKTYADPDYGSTSLPHQFFNDGELTVADVYDTTAKAWRTVAVGTTGRGPARAVYAIDVTNPAAYSLLWERSAADGKDNSSAIGQMTGKPVIAQTANGVWSVLIGNGYNSGPDSAALLQFALADGALTVHATDSTTGNGMAAPAVWIGDTSNGVSTEAYAGDILGRVWKFVLNDGTPRPSSTGSLVFTATNAAKAALPITAGMLMGRDPNTGNTWLFFGTGRYLAAADLQSKATQSWFGIIVGSTDTTLTDNLASKGRGALVVRTIDAESTQGRSTSPATAGDLAGKSGWYMDLTSPTKGSEGERMVNANGFDTRRLVGITRIPVATDVCNPSGGGWAMYLDPFTGSSFADNVFDTNGDGAIDGKDGVTSGGKTAPNNGVYFGSLPNGATIIGKLMVVTMDNGSRGQVLKRGGNGERLRVSWRELVNP